MAPDKPEVIKINLRLSKSLHRRLQQATKSNNTSLQQEIVGRLEQTFNPKAQAELIQQTVTAAVEAFKVVLGPGITAGGDKDR
jgi:hypothetical protein